MVDEVKYPPLRVIKHMRLIPIHCHRVGEGLESTIEVHSLPLSTSTSRRPSLRAGLRAKALGQGGGDGCLRGGGGTSVNPPSAIRGPW